MNDFFDTGIYVVIVVAAMLLGLMIVLMMTASTKPQKQRRPARNQPTGRQKTAPPELKLLTEGGPPEDMREKKPGKDKKSRQEKQRNNPKQRKQDKREQEKADKKQADRIPANKLATVAAIGEEVEVPTVESVKIAELPSVNTLDDSEEVDQEDTPAKEDLMSIFQVEEAEDSYVSDLANKLFDIETSNIQELGLEVLAVFSVNKTNEESKEE
jgi:hypothetical protein